MYHYCDLSHFFLLRRYVPEVVQSKMKLDPTFLNDLSILVCLGCNTACLVTTVSYEYTEKLVMIVYNIKNDLTPLWSAHWPGVTCTKFAGGRGKTWIWNLYNSCCLSNNINIYVFAYLLFPVSKVILQQSKLIWYKVTFILYFFFFLFLLQTSESR